MVLIFPLNWIVNPIPYNDPSRSNTHTNEPSSRAAAAQVGSATIAKPAVALMQKLEQEVPQERLPMQLQQAGAFSPPPPVNGVNPGSIQPFQLKTATGIVQKVSTFTGEINHCL